MPRIGVFVDVQNIYLCTRAVYQQGKINYEILKNFVQREGSLVTLSAFTCYDPALKPQIDFMTRLALIGYRVVSKPIKRLPDGSVKASMDLEMAMEVLNQAPHLDEIVLVTGDGDFAPLVSQLCLLGKVVRVIGPDLLSAPELIQACHDFTNLHRISGILEVRDTRPFSGSPGGTGPLPPRGASQE